MSSMLPLLDILDTPEVLSDFSANNEEVFLRCEPEIVDFRKVYTGAIKVCGKNGEISFGISENISTWLGALKHSLFSGDTIIISWNIKNLISYLRFHLEYNPDIAAHVYDLRLAEAFLDINQPCPLLWEEAYSRFKLVIDNENVRKIHHHIHIPLSLGVIPSLEATPITHIKYGKAYSSYVIEGQENGRMSCHKSFDGCLTPHNFRTEKEHIRAGFGETFIMIDYMHMEAAVLQWLSNDEKLKKIIKSGKDLYSIVYTLLSNNKCEKDEQRSLIKQSLLPVFYGLQAKTLSEKLNIGFGGATWIIAEIKKHFATAFNWLDGEQERARNSITQDCLGRIRDCRNNPLVARNAVVQGPAAMICQEKLIDLFDKIRYNVKVICSIHDGYLLSAHKKDLDKTIQQAQEILESPSSFCPGLKLKTKCKVGDNLLELVDYKR